MPGRFACCTMRSSSEVRRLLPEFDQPHRHSHLHNQPGGGVLVRKRLGLGGGNLCWRAQLDAGLQAQQHVSTQHRASRFVEIGHVAGAVPRGGDERQGLHPRLTQRAAAGGAIGCVGVAQQPQAVAWHLGRSMDRRAVIQVGHGHQEFVASRASKLEQRPAHRSCCDAAISKQPSKEM